MEELSGTPTVFISLRAQLIVLIIHFKWIRRNSIITEMGRPELYITEEVGEKLINRYRKLFVVMKW